MDQLIRFISSFWYHKRNTLYECFKKALLIFLLLTGIFGFSKSAISQTTTVSAGSFIVNMGITPQTFANGLHPYGMIYDIVKNYHGSIMWAISPTKSKDGIDFSYNGVDYKGGTFIIPANYRTDAINGRITYWTGTPGVIGVTTTAPITLPYTTLALNNMPQWTLDYANGSIAVNFFNGASIPSSAYGGSSQSGWKTPAQLNCCDDIFVMPHADPLWSTHGHLLDWNLDCKGAIWLGCHAGSALMDMFNPATPTQQTNFLCAKSGTATGSGPYCQNALVLWGNHDDGTPPYSYNYPTDPIMQFMGTIDAAQQNGSEQIYMPIKTALGGHWNSGAKIYVWDPNQVNVVAGIITNGPAATLVSGRGFDDPNRGRVLLEAGHNISGSGTANVAAMRAFFNFSYYATQEKASTLAPVINPITSPEYAGTAYPLSFTFSGNLSQYTILWSASCAGTFTPNATVANPTFTPATVSAPTTCIISLTLTDIACPLKTLTDNQSIQIACNLSVTTTLTNPCYGVSNGVIAMSITGGAPVYDWSWTRGGGGSGSGTGTVISGLSAGIYTVTVTSGGGSGCSNVFTSTLTEYPQIIVTATPTPVLCNGDATGGITVSVTGGVLPYTYNWGGGITTQNRSGLIAGTYNVTVTDSKGCTGAGSAVVTQPNAIVITPTVTNVACNGNTTGAISLAVTGGTGAYTYAWSDGPTTQNHTSLAAGSYAVTVTDANNCTHSLTGISVTQASAISASASAGTISCNGGTTTVTVTASGGTGLLQYNLNGGTYQTGNTFTVSASASPYIVTVKDANNCTTTTSVLVTQPAALTLSTVLTPETCPSGTSSSNGAIVLTVTGGTTSYSYAWTASAGGVVPFGQATNQNLTGLKGGDYTVIVTDAHGCTATVTVTIHTINSDPVPSGTINH